MTVRELIELLQQIENKDRVVIMGADAEGSRHSLLYSTWEGNHKPWGDCPWYSDVGVEALTEKLQCQGYTEEDVVVGEPALILVPTN